MFNLIVVRRNLIKAPNVFRCLIHQKSLKTLKPLNDKDSSSSSSPRSKFTLSKKSKTPEFVITTLKSYDFTDAQIKKVVAKYPQLLAANMDAVIKPKLDYYLSLGYPRADLGKFISTYPRSLNPSLEKRIKPNVELLRSYLGSDQQLILALNGSCRLLQDNISLTLIPNIKTLESYGVCHAHIAKFISIQPRKLILGSDKFVKIVKSVKELGFDPTSFRFVKALIAMLGLGNSSWDKKMEAYKSFGLSETDVNSAFVKYPQCMDLSEDKIKRAFDFFAKEMHWEPSFLMGCPVLLTFSLEKRILPRCMIMGILASKGLVRNYPSTSYQFILLSESNFFEKYVMKYKRDVPEVLDVFKVKSKSKKLSEPS